MKQASAFDINTVQSTVLSSTSKDQRTGGQIPKKQKEQCKRKEKDSLQPVTSHSV